MRKSQFIVIGLFGCALLISICSTVYAKPGNGNGKPGGGDPPPSSADYSLLLSKCCFGEVFVSSEDPSQLTRVWDKSIANHEQAVWLPGGEQFAFNGNYALGGGDWIRGIWSAKPDGSIVETLVLATDTFRVSGVDSSIASANQNCGATTSTPRLFFLAGDYDQNVPYGSYIDVYSVDPFNPGTLDRETNIPGFSKRAMSVSGDGELLAVWLVDESGSGSLQIRDLCDDSQTDPLWQWDAEELGLDANHHVNQMDWSVDGMLALATLTSGPDCAAYCEATIWLVDLTSASDSSILVERLTGPDGLLPGIERGISPAWSPDGSQLMFSSATQKKTRMYLYDRDSDSYETVANFSTLSLDWKPD